MKKLIYSAIALVLCLSLTAQEKKKDKIKRKAKEKTEKRLDQKIDKTLDDGLNKLEGLFKRKKKKKKESEKANTENIFDMMRSGGRGSDYTLKSDYTFASSAKIQFKVYETSKGKETGTFYAEYFFSSKEDYLGMKFMDELGKANESLKMTIIDSGQSISFMESGVSKIATSFDLSTVVDESANEENWTRQATPTKTGQTKEIAGYHCDEYIMIDEQHNTRFSFWVAPELMAMAQKMAGVFQGFQSKGGSLGFNPSGKIDMGMIMEMEMTDQDDGTRLTMKVKEVKPGTTHHFSTEGYQMFSVSN